MSRFELNLLDSIVKKFLAIQLGLLGSFVSQVRLYYQIDKCSSQVWTRVQIRADIKPAGQTSMRRS